MAIDTSTYHHPTTLELTRHAEANELIASEPSALLIGWICDQQVRVQQAFSAPLHLAERLGTLEPAELAAMPVEQIVEAFVAKPPLHRYGRSMANRVHACMQVVVDQYGGDVERIWLEAEDYDDLARRVHALPGFGMTKVPAFIAMLVRQFGLDVRGFEGDLPSYGSLSEVRTYDDLTAYQARKQEWKQGRAERSAGVRHGTRLGEFPEA
ncbi:MAG: Fe-S cluster assembly protein HesB [Thermoleophilia bacterium]|nr:Fe-S cluster assembly protein HesB [Thermoleophilia bacterium]